MPTIVDHDQAVQLLREEFNAIIELCDPLAEGAWDTATCLPGWTVKDVLAHMTGTESMLAGDPVPDADLSGLTHLRNDIARSNELWVQTMRPLPGAEVLDRFREVTARRLATLEAMSQEDFDAPSWTPAGPNETYGRFMQIRHYDCFLHEHDMRAALGIPDRDDPVHLAAALREPATALGYIVGRKAALPKGSTVTVALTGPAAVTWHVAVDDRAAVVDELPGAAATTLTLPAMLFLRLTGGREEAGPHLDRELVISGDRELGTALATHLAYTI